MDRFDKQQGKAFAGLDQFDVGEMDGEGSNVT